MGPADDPNPDIPTWSSRVEDFIQLPHSIRLVINPIKTRGFYAATQLKFWERTNEKFKDPRNPIILYPMIWNDTKFYHNFTYDDRYWESTIVKIQPKYYWYHESSRELWVHNLRSKTAFRFKFRQCDELTITEDS